MQRVLIGLAVLVACFAAVRAGAQTGDGTSLADFLDDLTAAGLKIVYSSDLVTDDMRLASVPAGPTPEARLADALAPFNLKAEAGPGGSLLIVPGPARPAPPAPAPAEERPAAVPIPEVVVTSSLHRLQYKDPATQSRLERELATRIPTVADDAVRLTDRLPGTASGGVSTRNHIRGGEANEVLFLLDGLRLYEPYHLKDFQSIATIVNASAIDGMDFFTGAYPARYGDRMSGVMNIDLRRPVKPTETEIALSLFNTSVLSLGQFGAQQQGEWLLSGRRSNLDLLANLLESDFGSPAYHDVIGRLGWSFGPRATLSANILFAKDELELRDEGRGEAADANYKNEVYWLKWDAEWTPELASTTTFAHSDISNRREGSLELPGIVTGTLSEDNAFRVSELRQEWTWIPTKDWMLRAGGDVKRMDGDYDFHSERRIEAPFDQLPGNEAQTRYDFVLDPRGNQYAAYGEVRWRALPPLVVELGLRWDQQTYTTASDDRQVSPRAALLYEAGSATSLRFGWGQYYQAQEINELQVSDGIDTFFPAQQAEHFVLNLRHHFNAGIELDLSAYRKRFRVLRPRFENGFNSLTLLPEIQFDRTRVDARGGDAVGAELMLSAGDGEDALLWWLAYAWSRVDDHTDNGDVPRSWDQTHTVKGGLAWNWGGWDFSAAGEIHTGWPLTPLRGELVPLPGGEVLTLDVGARNSERYGDFRSLDLRISRDFRVGRGSLTTFIAVTNAADRANPCCTEYSLYDGEDEPDEDDAPPPPPGSLQSKQGTWLPLLPSIGIVLRF